MKLGIMQPYFLPYIGYFQLINLVDKYVIYDDVNFIKGGWINRNRILLNGEPFMVNVIMQGASSFKKINEIEVARNNEKILKTIEQAYKKAPYFNDVFPLLFDIIKFKNNNLASFIFNSITVLSDYMKIKTHFVLSSEIQKNNELKGQDKVIDICKLLDASEYYNAIGGQSLYNKLTFAENNIGLKFVNTKFLEYKQFDSPFVPSLSIIDVLMFNSIDNVNDLLNKCEIV